MEFIEIKPGHELWPAQIATTGDEQSLWVSGRTELLTRPLADHVILCGARAATGYGEHVAMELSAGLVGRGKTVVTGGAYGIDGMATRAALASGGDAIVFLGSGLDRLYPAGHQALLERVAQSGLLVSIVPPGSAPTRWRFLQRNAVMAEFAGATVVVEAGRRSGALTIASTASDLGRGVGAVPGPVTSAASEGTHDLLRNGARLVRNAGDIVELLPTVVTL